MAIQEALKGATDVPFETAKACMSVVHLAIAAGEIGNQAAVTDAAVGALTAAAGLEGAILNIRINLSDIVDPVWKAVKEAELRELEGDLATENAGLRELTAAIAPLG